MKKEPVNRIEIEWKELFKPIPGLQTSPYSDPLTNMIIIKPEIIPIIFVPGIMGSRLKYTSCNKKAWDPDSKGFMVFKHGFNSSPEKRKKNLIGDQPHNSQYLEVDNENTKHNKKLPKGMAEHGWGGVSLTFYGKILKALKKRKWPEPLRQCFDFPVYSFGYNWTATNDESGKKLAGYIEKVITENAKQYLCNHVILVTHSMGGLVARSACMLHGAEGKVLGVVHGVQPATGSPAAYLRMKNGFEPPDSPTGEAWDWFRTPLRIVKHKAKGHVSRTVLGNSGKDVTIILANSPGGLELLPNKLYKTNNGSRKWLRFTNRHSATVDLPKSDPYTEIYENRKAPYRLINEEWLGFISENKKVPFKTKTKKPWNLYIRNLECAKSFHNNLQAALHPETFQFFSTKIKTADNAEIVCNRVAENKGYYVEACRHKGFLEIEDGEGKRLTLHDVLFVSAFSEDTYKDTVLYAFTLAPPNGEGDGTVPDSSGRALEALPTGYIHGPEGTAHIGHCDENWFDRQHDAVYDTKSAQKITFNAIENLCKTKIKKETGAA